LIFQNGAYLEERRRQGPAGCVLAVPAARHGVRRKAGFQHRQQDRLSLKHIYVSENNNNSWDEDILGRDVLDDGEEFEVAFDKAENVCKWDMKVVYDDGESAVWQGLNLCQITKLTLKWNKNTGVTSAKTE